VNIPIFQVDAVTDKMFSGNPAAVCLLEQWLTDDRMQAIAAENNLSETAVLVVQGDDYALRWFTPQCVLIGQVVFGKRSCMASVEWRRRSSLRAAR